MIKIWNLIKELFKPYKCDPEYGYNEFKWKGKIYKTWFQVDFIDLGSYGARFESKIIKLEVEDE